MNQNLNSPKSPDKKKSTIDMGLWIVYGFAAGTVLGILFNNLVLGMIFGLCAGVIIGAIADGQKQKK